MTVEIPRNGRVLFIGDSITDGGRDRANDLDLGHGYAGMAAGRFGVEHPAHGVTFLNRGISGNTLLDLRDRWQADCLDLAPDVLSVLIGINDSWRALHNGVGHTTAEEFGPVYRDLLARARPVARHLLLIEPFVMPFSDERYIVRADVQRRIQVVRQLADEFDATLVAADDVFAKAITRAEVTHWTTDGIHLTPAGNALLAQEWLRAVHVLDETAVA